MSKSVLRIKVILITMITVITSLFFGFGYDEPEAFSPNEYLVSTVDSSKVADSISVKSNRGILTG